MLLGITFRGAVSRPFLQLFILPPAGAFLGVFVRGPHFNSRHTPPLPYPTTTRLPDYYLTLPGDVQTRHDPTHARALLPGQW